MISPRERAAKKVDPFDGAKTPSFKGGDEKRLLRVNPEQAPGIHAGQPKG